MTLESSGFELKNVLENKKPKWKKKKKKGFGFELCTGLYPLKLH